MELCDIDWLPTPEVILARSKAAATADLLLTPEPDLRQFRCDRRWKGDLTFAQRHDGAGSYYYILQSGDTMVIKVSALHASIGPDALARFQRAPTVPMPELAVRVLNDPEMRNQELSFLAWSEGGQPWQGLLFRVDGKTSLEMGKALLDLVCLGPRAYYVYAQSYHEVTLDPTALKSLFALTPLNDALVQSLSPGARLATIQKELETIGYPVA